MTTPTENSGKVQSILKDIRDSYHGENWPSTDRGDGAWTKIILQKTGELGHKEGFYVCTNRESCPDAKYGEWLFDLCWLEYEDSMNPETPLISIPLVLECEWQMGSLHLKHDLEKLLIAKASLKVMIFQQKTNEDARKIFEEMKSWIERYDPARVLGAFLLCCYVQDSETRNFIFEEV